MGTLSAYQPFQQTDDLDFDGYPHLALNARVGSNLTGGSQQRSPSAGLSHATATAFSLQQILSPKNAVAAPQLLQQYTVTSERVMEGRQGLHSIGAMVGLAALEPK